jgi:hypothetical protein
MTLRSGLAAQIGFADEATWGVPVTPTVFVPLVDESLTQEIARIESNAIISGARMLHSQEWGEGNVTAGGDVGLELYDRDTGLLLKHMFGGSSSTGPFSPADLSGLGLTTQVGVPDSNTGTVHPKTYAGCKVMSWEIAAKAGENATLGLTLSSRHEILHRSVTDGVTTSGSAAITSATAAWIQDDVGKPISGTGIPAGATIASVTSATAATLSANATATGTGITFTIGVALAAASYTSGIKAFRFIDASVTVAGSAFKVKEASIAGNNAPDADRRFLNQKTIDEQLEAERREYTGTLNTEFFDETMYRRFLAGAESALVVAFSSGAKSLTFTMNVRYDGTTAQVGGRGVVQQELPYKCVGTTTDAAGITAVLV